MQQGKTTRKHPPIHYANGIHHHVMNPAWSSHHHQTKPLTLTCMPHIRTSFQQFPNTRNVIVFSSFDDRRPAYSVLPLHLLSKSHIATFFSVVESSTEGGEVPTVGCLPYR
ncbi:uncharacterized protein SPPG_08970 [Spizellomyces punctatus DAOM BR117]|uniref:Uncharacterized protein n=1 Tax=Spizellomyces punctatus (strain DAOM BR117) TaxID=645134 RepID=A0A0L0HQ03_SPIPD|nr:uncharacterized protein SPPG_08970 [Spizellomyces punctatus DAOM BR117]KND02889.1 hypothetical protein SPPG_08970 [Spizellomyces punctatus DAOM BR117]|eukprot:XP_016610928.1 hypothetical protein SPPG_08970 [Spizellomyces punctatus DAOM BR117]